MDEAAPTWPQLAERARTALDGVEHLRATVSLRDGDQLCTHAVWFGAPDRWRVEDENGLLVLHSGEVLYLRAARRGPRLESTDGTWAPGPELGYLGWGHPRLFLDPPQTPEDPGRIRADAVAGRPAWTLRLISPGEVPHPLDVTLDAATGLPLRVAAVGAPYVTEVTALARPAALDPGLFTVPVPGPAPRPSPSDGAEAAVELTRRGLRLPGRIPGLGDVGDWSIVDADAESESFVAVGRSPREGVVALARTALSHPPSRPLAAASGVSIGARLPRHVYAWHDDQWSYELLTDADLDQRHLATLAVPGTGAG